MRRRLFSLFAVAIVMATATSSLLAQDPLEEIAKKTKIGDTDRAKIQTQVNSRVQKLSEAGKDAEQRVAARERLVSPARIKGASRDFLDSYAEACGDELTALAGSEVFESGFDAVLVLSQLNNAKAAKGLSAGLKSIHSATRMRAARGLAELHKPLVTEEKTAKFVLRTLGEAGAEETQRIVLRAIYQAIDLGQDAKADPLADDCAKALNAVFTGRLTRFAAGARDETSDEFGVVAAGRYYPLASEAQQKLLIGNLAKLLRHAVDRYFADDTAEGYKPVLATEAKRIEDTIREMIKASKAREPNKSVSDTLKKGSKGKEAADAALQELQGVLKGDPWNIS